MIGALAVAGAGGAIAQQTALPGWVQAIAPANPVHWTIDAYRSGARRRAGVRPGAVGMHLGFAILFIAVTLWAFRVEGPKESYGRIVMRALPGRGDAVIYGG